MSLGANSLPGWRGKSDPDPDAHAGPAAADQPEAADDSDRDAARARQSQGTTDSHAVTGGEGEHEPVVVWEAETNLEAEIVKGRLESEGIPAFLSGEAVGTIYGLTTGNLAATDVLVPGPLAEKALEILQTEVVWDDDIWADTDGMDADAVDADGVDDIAAADESADSYDDDFADSPGDAKDAS